MDVGEAFEENAEELRAAWNATRSSWRATSKEATDSIKDGLKDAWAKIRTPRDLVSNAAEDLYDDVRTGRLASSWVTAVETRIPNVNVPAIFLGGLKEAAGILNENCMEIGAALESTRSAWLEAADVGASSIRSGWRDTTDAVSANSERIRIVADMRISGILRDVRFADLKKLLRRSRAKELKRQCLNDVSALLYAEYTGRVVPTEALRRSAGPRGRDPRREAAAKRAWLARLNTPSFGPGSPRVAWRKSVSAGRAATLDKAWSTSAWLESSIEEEEQPAASSPLFEVEDDVPLSRDPLDSDLSTLQDDDEMMVGMATPYSQPDMSPAERLEAQVKQLELENLRLTQQNAEIRAKLAIAQLDVELTDKVNKKLRDDEDKDPATLI